MTSWLEISVVDFAAECVRLLVDPSRTVMVAEAVAVAG